VILSFNGRPSARSAAPFPLGPLEIAVMEVVWSRPASSVHHVTARLDRPLAYTTVMTTLDRLYKKGLLERRKSERAFLYSARLSRSEWQREQAGDLVSGLLSDPRHPSDLLISCLVDAVGRHDEALLDELERKVRQKRKEISTRDAASLGNSNRPANQEPSVKGVQRRKS
jgi:predicted transcriptional regulator